MRLLIASRKSDLAKLQSYRVAEALHQVNPDVQIEFHFRESLGDKDQVSPLEKMPAKGVFTEDFVQGLAQNEFDLVVHSWKDLPTEPRAETEVVATLPRADARDVLLMRKKSIEDSSRPWKILSSSPRRLHFLSLAWKDLAPAGSPDLSFEPVRGNIATRLSKLIRGDGDGILMAKAALDRLLLSTESEFSETREKIQDCLILCDWMILPLSVQPPAAAQGALAIEISKKRLDLRDLLAKINCAATFANVSWERRQLAASGGGCHQKLGFYQKDFPEFGGLWQLEAGEGPQTGPHFKSEWVLSSTRAPMQNSPCAPGPKKLVALRSEDLFTFESPSGSGAQDSWAGKKLENVYVGHSRAWVADLNPQRIYTSGVATWKKLAKQGVWVNGCSESLGEEIPSLAHFQAPDEQKSWTKLSHESAPSHPDMPLKATYKLRPRESLSNDCVHMVKNGTHYFWHSGHLLQEALRLFPEIRDRQHSCGLGATRHTLQTTQLPCEPTVFLGEEHWRKHHEK